MGLWLRQGTRCAHRHGGQAGSTVSRHRFSFTRTSDLKRNGTAQNLPGTAHPLPAGLRARLSGGVVRQAPAAPGHDADESPLHRAGDAASLHVRPGDGGEELRHHHRGQRPRFAARLRPVSEARARTHHQRYEGVSWAEANRRLLDLPLAWRPLHTLPRTQRAWREILDDGHHRRQMRKPALLRLPRDDRRLQRRV